MLLWKDVERTKTQHLSKKHFSCVILSLYLHLSNFVISFFLHMGFSHQKLQNSCAVCTSRTKSHSQMPAVQNQDLWALVASNRISRKYIKIASGCFLLYILIPALKWCSKDRHNMHVPSCTWIPSSQSTLRGAVKPPCALYVGFYQV